MSANDREFAQTVVRTLHDELNRAHGKEMHATPTQLLFAAKHALESMLRDVVVLETERKLSEDRPHD